MADTDQLQKEYASALDLHEQGQYSKAVDVYKKILASFPDADLVLYNMGLALYELADFTGAAACFLKAAEKNPDDPDYWFNAGLSLKRAGQYQEAVAAYEKAGRLQPDDADVVYNLGSCLQAAGRLPAAVAAYEKALDRTVDHIPALSNLSYCIHRSGDHVRAAELYRRLLDLQPDHVSARYMLDALEGKNTTSPPPGYVAELFDGYSENFDTDLLENLSYRVPDLLADLLAEYIGRGEKNMRVVDLGCGTGLSGAAIFPFARFLVGVDLSAKMVAEADKKGCYDQLVVGDVVDFLNNLNGLVDLLLAADVLTYLGDLRPLFGAVRTSVRPGGLFCFSTEYGEEGKWQLRSTGRYAHHPEYISGLAQNHGWEVLNMQRARLRKELDGWITGTICLLIAL